MKRLSFFESVLALGLGLLGLASAGCNNPEGYCEGWVADQCDALASCCKSGATFDKEQCILSLSSQCQEFTEVEKVHAGEVKFDSGAASTCMGVVESCEEATRTPEEEFDRQVACANVITGFRPPGAACSRDSECESSGEFSECWQGNGNGLDTGVCASVVLTGDGSCGFSIETNELTACNIEEFCDSSDFTPNPNDPPSKQVLEFKGKCKPFLDNGGVCFDPNGNKLTPCKSGLYCDVSNGMSGICTPQKGEGEVCNGNSECKDPLNCDFNGANQVCTKGEVNGPFCFTPPVCGDGMCNFQLEMDSCPQDCGGGVDCGDGFCDTGANEPSNCPVDCCGDFICEPGEAGVCAQDCATP
ncbi:MAG: hypothetical protein U0414_26880 [Polyangiaceae bacterium]